MVQKMLPFYLIEQCFSERSKISPTLVMVSEGRKSSRLSVLICENIQLQHENHLFFHGGGTFLMSFSFFNVHASVDYCHLVFPDLYLGLYFFETADLQPHV